MSPCRKMIDLFNSIALPKENVCPHLDVVIQIESDLRNENMPEMKDEFHG